MNVRIYLLGTNETVEINNVEETIENKKTLEFVTYGNKQTKKLGLEIRFKIPKAVIKRYVITDK